MKRSFDDYERVARGLFGCSSVWLGPDHLLYIRGKGLIFPVVEEYRRFRYRDIEALTIARTDWFFWGAVLYALGVAVMGGWCALMLAFRSPGETGVLLFTLLFPFPLALGFLFLLVRQLVYGKRCVCMLQTDQRRIRLRPLSALHRADEVVKLIAPKISQAQKEIVVGGGESHSPSPPPIDQTLPMRVKAIVPIACGGVAIGGLLLIALSFFASMPLSVFTLLFLSGATIALLVALTGAVRRPTPDGVRSLLWTILGVITVIGGTGLIYLFTISIDDPSYTLGTNGFFRAFADLGSVGAAAFQFLFAAFGGLLAIVSVLTLISAQKWRRVLASKSDG